MALVEMDAVAEPQYEMPVADDHIERILNNTVEALTFALHRRCDQARRHGDQQGFELRLGKPAAETDIGRRGFVSPYVDGPLLARYFAV
jgi:hypothetical protein